MPATVPTARPRRFAARTAPGALVFPPRNQAQGHNVDKQRAHPPRTPSRPRAPAATRSQMRATPGSRPSTPPIRSSVCGSSRRPESSPRARAPSATKLPPRSSRARPSAISIPATQPAPAREMTLRGIARSGRCRASNSASADIVKRRAARIDQAPRQQSSVRSAHRRPAPPPTRGPAPRGRCSPPTENFPPAPDRTTSGLCFAHGNTN